MIKTYFLNAYPYPVEEQFLKTLWESTNLKRQTQTFPFLWESLIKNMSRRPKLQVNIHTFCWFMPWGNMEVEEELNSSANKDLMSYRKMILFYTYSWTFLLLTMWFFLSYKRSRVLLFLWFHKEKKIIVKTKETFELDANVWILYSWDSCITFSWLTLCRPKRLNPQTHILGPPVCVCVCVCVCTHLVAFNYFATPWTVAQQPPLSMGFSRQKYWSVFSSLGDLWDPWIETASLASPALAGRFLTTAPPGKPGSSFPPGCMILEHITISCPHLLNNTQTHTHTHTPNEYLKG